MGASWYFGIRGGVLTAVLSILASTIILVTDNVSHLESFDTLETLIGSASLIMVALVVGNLGRVTRERRKAILKLEQYEQEHKAHTHFLELLNEITAMALEADSLDSTLQILGERLAALFQADDCFFSQWDEVRQVPIPMVAYGSLRDIYSYMQFEPGELTLTTSVMDAGHPIAVPDIENSPYISPHIAAIFPSRSMLGLPLLAQRRKLGALLLGYNKAHSFREEDLLHAQLTAEQVSLVLSKSFFLEEERKQVKQLTALHDIALIAIDVDNEDELINRVTDVIGRNLFPDNFGILLLGEQDEILHAHPSYRFFSEEERHMMDISIDQGVTGLVARTGMAQRIGNVRQTQEYLDVDDRTISELCVPIKFKERILGVINAESTKKGAFTEEDERLLTTLAGQIATALEQLRKTQAERKWLDQLANYDTHRKGLRY
jgi:GAF domain-containing protein